MKPTVGPKTIRLDLRVSPGGSWAAVVGLTRDEAEAAREGAA